MTLAVFWFGALGPQEIKRIAALTFNLQCLVNAHAQFFAAGTAADFVHDGKLFPERRLCLAASQTQLHYS